MSEANKPAKIVIDESNCEELTGYKPADLALLTGINAYTSSYTYSILGHSLAPSIHVKSNDENVAMRRTFQLKDMVIENDRIDVVEQDQGTAIKIFTRQVELCKKNGYKFITCIAARDINMGGYYVWARAGFIIHPDSIKDVEVHLQRSGFNGDETAPHAIVQNPAHRAWWKENGITWEGIFDLSDGSESMRILHAYNDEKQKKNINDKNEENL